MKGKKRRVKSIVWVIVAVLVLGVLGGFGIKAYKDYQKEEAAKKEAARIKKLQEQAKLSKDQISIEVRGTYNLKLYSAEGKVTWSSEDAAVARVDEKGVVTGVSAGNTVINATYLKKKYPVKVTVTMPRVMQDDGKKVVYLTFDDGPSPKTAQVLDILKNNGVHATFFVTGIDQKSASLMKRAVDEGNAIGAHTYTHDYKYVYSSEKNYFDDLNKILNHIKEVTGKETKIIRFQGGSSNTISRKYSQGIMTKLSKEVLAKGYQYYDWNLSSGDAEWPAPSVASIAHQATNTKQSKVVLLMHDANAKQTTVDALPQIIKFYKDNGYEFRTLENSDIISHHHINN